METIIKNKETTTLVEEQESIIPIQDDIDELTQRTSPNSLNKRSNRHIQRKANNRIN